MKFVEVWLMPLGTGIGSAMLIAGAILHPTEEIEMRVFAIYFAVAIFAITILVPIYVDRPPKESEEEPKSRIPVDDTQKKEK